MELKFNKKNLYIIGFALLGLLLLLYYIWFRFVRERLLHDIPFILTIPLFISLCILCAIYMYLIFRKYIPRKSLGILEIFSPIIHKLYKPFYILDMLIRRSYILKSNYIKVIYEVIVYFKLYYYKRHQYLYFSFNIIPKIVLLLSLIIDIFYFEKLHYFYLLLGLGLLPLGYNYNIYLLEQYVNNISNYLDKYYGVKILSTEEEDDDFFEKYNTPYFFVSVHATLDHLNEDGLLDSKKFIQLQALNLTEDCHLYKYTCIETWFAREMYIKKYKILRPSLWVFEPESDEISKALASKFKELMPQAYYFQSFIEEHYFVIKYRIKIYDIYILLINLICWMYILCVSIHTLDYSYMLEFIKDTWTIIPDPFSDIAMSCFIVQLYKKSFVQRIQDVKKHLQKYIVVKTQRDESTLNKKLNNIQKKIHEHENKNK